MQVTYYTFFFPILFIVQKLKNISAKMDQNENYKFVEDRVSVQVYFSSGSIFGTSIFPLYNQNNVKVYN